MRRYLLKTLASYTLPAILAGLILAGAVVWIADRLAR